MMDWLKFERPERDKSKPSRPVDPVKAESETVIRLTRELGNAYDKLNSMHRRAQQAEADVLSLRRLSEYLEKLVSETVMAASHGYEAMLKPHAEVKEMCGKKLRDARAASRLYQKVFERVSFVHKAFKDGDQHLFEQGLEHLIEEVDRFYEELN